LESLRFYGADTNPRRRTPDQFLSSVRTPVNFLMDTPMVTELANWLSEQHEKQLNWLFTRELDMLVDQSPGKLNSATESRDLTALDCNWPVILNVKTSYRLLRSASRRIEGQLKTRDLTTRDHWNCGGWHRVGHGSIFATCCKSNSTFLIFAVLVVWCRPCRR